MFTLATLFGIIIAVGLLLVAINDALEALLPRLLTHARARLGVMA